MCPFDGLGHLFDTRPTGTPTRFCIKCRQQVPADAPEETDEDREVARAMREASGEHTPRAARLRGGPRTDSRDFPPVGSDRQ